MRDGESIFGFHAPQHLKSQAFECGLEISLSGMLFKDSLPTCLRERKDTEAKGIYINMYI
jgi:hypothetical protein